MLKDLINWENIMNQPRCAGGHIDIMENLYKNSKVIDYYIEEEYQGEEIFLYKLDNKYILTSYYFGSCSGCDAYESCNDEELRNLCIQLANNSDIFESLNEVIDFLKNIDPTKHYKYSSLSEQFLNKLYNNKVVQRIFVSFLGDII